MPEKSLLDSLYIAAPCDANWDDMSGDERARMCELCTKKVYNISNMQKAEAEEFLRRQSTSICVRFYRRKDGTVITDDCPIGLRKIRDRLRRITRAVAAVCAFLIAVPAAMARHGSHCVNGMVSPLSKPPGTPAAKAKPVYSWPVTLTMGQSSDPATVWAHRTINTGMLFPVHQATPVLPTYEQLTSGTFHLSAEEICTRDQEIYLRLYVKPDSKKVGSGNNSESLERLDKSMTASQALLEAKRYAKLKEYRSAELYYKISIRYLETCKVYGTEFQNEVFTGYNECLRKSGRTPGTAFLMDVWYHLIDRK